MKEVNNILRILKETKEAIRKDNFSKLSSLSNQTINTASLTQDPDNITVAIIVYSLDKIFERINVKENEKNKFEEKIMNYLEESIKKLETGKEKLARNALKKIRGEIEKFSGSIKTNIKDVLRKASINKGSRIFEHGVSVETAADLLGVTQYEIASYVGQKDYEYSEGKTMDVKKRIKLAERFFE
jgi:hypothetical protein